MAGLKMRGTGERLATLYTHTYVLYVLYECGALAIHVLYHFNILAHRSYCKLNVCCYSCVHVHNVILFCRTPPKIHLEKVNMGMYLIWQINHCQLVLV